MHEHLHSRGPGWRSRASAALSRSAPPGAALLSPALSAAQRARSGFLPSTSTSTTACRCQRQPQPLPATALQKFIPPRHGCACGSRGSGRLLAHTWGRAGHRGSRPTGRGERPVPGLCSSSGPREAPQRARNVHTPFMPPELPLLGQLLKSREPA